MADFSQYAQDPLENFTQQCLDLFGSQSSEIPLQQPSKPEDLSRKTKKGSSKLTICKKKKTTPRSYVVSEKQRGTKLIQIRVLDLTGECEPQSDSQDKMVLSAQYVVRDPVDEIMDMTECIIKKISKKLCSDNL